MKTEIAILIGVVLFTSLFVFSKKRVSKSNHPTAEKAELAIDSSITGKNFVDTLTEIGYFNYTDPDNIDTLKTELIKIFDQHKVLTTVSLMKPPFEPFCRRLYSCDGETLFEFDGIGSYLKDVKATFDKLNIPLNWSNDDYSPDGTQHSIKINGKTYFAFKGDPHDPRAWGIATKNFVEMLNDQLRIHYSNERVYPIMFNNDGNIIFLTERQYNFVSQHLDRTERPMETELWWKTFQ